MATPHNATVLPPDLTESDITYVALAAPATVTRGVTSLTWSSSITAVAGVVDPATMLGHQLGDVLFSSVITAEPVAVSVLREAFTAAQREFSACQYVPLAGRLSALIVAAEATVTSHPDPATHQLLAETYNLATRALIKLEASGLEWLSADRGLHAARAAADPLTLADPHHRTPRSPAG